MKLTNFTKDHCNMFLIENAVRNDFSYFRGKKNWDIFCGVWELNV